MMSPCRIVLADDHVLVRQGIRKLIEESPDLQVVGEASDGSELFELLRNVKADLAILDITMPNISGIEATQRVKAIYPGLKVLILTMHKGRELLEHAIAAGANGYLLKEDAPQGTPECNKDHTAGGGIHVSPHRSLPERILCSKAPKG